ncbi:MAG: ABC transporter substrate-binding protein, partial [Anaerolineae bacterium]|nr:ABC transporter substrate-binding protein [Anaerolineae bacterium]
MAGGVDLDQGQRTALRVQLSWVHTLEFAGLYMADKQGFFAEQGLHVELVNGGYDSDGNYIDPVDAVTSGAASFGVTGADVILTRRAAGASIVAVASIYQRSPVALIALGAQRVIHPHDLIGKRIATEPGTSLGFAYDAFLMSQGISHGQVIEIPRTNFTTQPLLDHEVDVLLSFITDDGVNARKHDPETTILLLSDYGIDFYTNLIFASEAVIRDQPQVVSGFVKAVVKGLQYAVDNPQEAAQYVVDTYASYLTPDYVALQEPAMLASVPLIDPIGSRPGMILPAKMDATHQILLEQGVLSA